MHRTSAHNRVLFAIALATTLSACSHASSSRDTSTSSERARVDPPAGTRGASSIDACHLLTKDDIQQQIGVPVDDGKLQTTSSQATCDWAATGPSGAGLTVSVQDFDESLWSTFASSSRATPMSGLGEAAFAHVPTSPAVMIKDGKYEIELGVVDFSMSDDRALAATRSLAALVVARVSALK